MRAVLLPNLTSVSGRLVRRLNSLPPVSRNAGMLVLVLLACQGPTDSYVARPFAAIMIEGDAQTGTVGEALGTPITIRVRDQRGKPLRDFTVTWEAQSGDGDATPSTSQTDDRGEATTVWTLGAATGQQHLIAHVGDITREFTANGTPVAAAFIRLTPASLGLDLGEVDTIDAQVLASDSTVLADRPITWVSDDSTIARVGSKGDVTAIGGGITTIHATSGISTASLDVIVSTPVFSVTVGNFHTCALSTTNVAFCWGTNSFGQLGSGTTVPRFTPKKVNTSLIFSEISAGGSSTCAIAVDNSGWCWGSNATGQLGSDSASNALLPRQISGGFNWRSISTGVQHTCGVTNLRLGYCWGLGDDGRLGDSTSETSAVPVLVSGGYAWTLIVPGSNFTCGIVRSGLAYCWGNGQDGRLGDSSTTSSSVPVAVFGGHLFNTIALGDKFACGITTDQNTYCWGSGRNGRLGNGDVQSSSVPVLVGGGLSYRTGTVNMNSGADHTCAPSSTSVLYCWGNNDSGQLADGTTQFQISPVHGLGVPAMVQTSVANSTSCGVEQATRSLYCWGNNVYGQIGNGSNASSVLPTRVAGP